MPTTLDNFFLPGTQPDHSGGIDADPIRSAQNCRICHEVYDPVEYPLYSPWEGSMMANAARDPLFQAALTIANQDAAFAGDLCIRCHSPGGWLGGRSLPTDGAALRGEDFEGVTCNFCHRMVDPVLRPQNPAEDNLIRDALAAAGLLPVQSGSGNYVVDPDDVRRGPFPFVENGPPPNVPANYHGVPILHSPFHASSPLCGTCHDVSNPAFSRQADGSYTLNPLGAEHPTQDPRDMFPIERTYSEWANSTYATIGIDGGGVFGGNHPTGIMRTCQDCHMPDTQSYGCAFDGPDDPFYERPNVPAHDFAGGSTWLQDVLRNLYPFTLQPEYLEDSQVRSRYMLENACTLELTHDACDLNVRILNETGHKLPTGYPDGRRMWIEVEFRDDALHTVASRGAYGDVTADLTTSDTKVYEAILGIDAAVAGLTGLPEGPSFHFAINNEYYKDNRIPPRGFTNAGFESVGAAPVVAIYADGQYWDDTAYRVPPGATSAVVRVYYQTASKEYITFLRDENRTNEAGDLLYEQWQTTGRSAPVLMRERVIADLTAGPFGDADCDGNIDLEDHRWLDGCVTGPGRRLDLGCEALDADTNGEVDLDDFAAYQNTFADPE